MLTIRLPGAVFEFDHIQYKGGGMDALLTVSCEKPTDPLEALDWDPGRRFSYHLSGRSLSNVTAYRRELEKFFQGYELEWGKLLHEAIHLAEQEYRKGAQSDDPWGVEDLGAGQYLVDGVFPLNQVSCVFGMGAAGKSLVLESVLAAVTTGTPWLGKPTLQHNILWLDYEAEHMGQFGGRRLALANGGQDYFPGSVRWMPARGIPLLDLVDTVKREMDRFSVGVFVVDSVAFACGGDPIKAEVATQFYTALAELPLSTKLLIAHTDKAENDKYPFGSIFWHNGIHGMSWYLKALKKDDELTIGWYGRKVSDGPSQRDFASKLDFDDGIHVSAGNLKLVSQEYGKASAADRIYDHLIDEGAARTSELAKLLSLDAGVVRARLKDLRERGQVVKHNDKWEATV